MLGLEKIFGKGSILTVTNAERIQNLSVEDLAKFLNSFSCNCLGGGVKGKCSFECKIKPREKDCCTEKDILTWLKERSKR